MSDSVKCEGCSEWGTRKRQDIAPAGWRFLRLVDTDAPGNEFYVYACSPACVARISGAWEEGPGKFNAPPPEGSLQHARPRPGRTEAEEVEALRDGVVRAADALIAALEEPAAKPEPKPQSALEAWCPTCHEPPGYGCRDIDGRTYTLPDVHPARAKMVDRAKPEPKPAEAVNAASNPGAHGT